MSTIMLSAAPYFTVFSVPARTPPTNDKPRTNLGQEVHGSKRAAANENDANLPVGADCGGKAGTDQNVGRGAHELPTDVKNAGGVTGETVGGGRCAGSHVTWPAASHVSPPFLLISNCRRLPPESTAGIKEEAS